MAPDSPSPHPIAAAVARVALFVLVSVLAGAVVAGAAAPFVGGVGVATKSAVDGFQLLPLALTAPQLPQRSVILAADGSRLATIYYQNRIEVPLERIAPVMRQAIVAIEDSRFYEHNGFDMRGFLRAAVGNAGGGQVQGGSTITQQYVKQVLINSAATPEEARAAQARNLPRKIKELRYALALEKQYTKDQILERYLNIAYFGAGAYGIEAAARRYFSRSAATLSLAQAATLAGLVQQPIRYDPLRHAAAAQYRRNQVLDRMADLGYVTRTLATKTQKIAVAKLVKPQNVSNGCTTSWAPFFCDYVINVMRNDPAFGATAPVREELLRDGGLTIRTTIDRTIQDGASKAAADYIPIKDRSGKVAAISMVQPGTGRILAMAQNRLWGVKGRGYTTYNYNVGLARGGGIGAQAGSTFKAFTLAAALQQGLSPYERIDSPQEKKFDGLPDCKGTIVDGNTVSNSTGSGSFNMLSGAAFSINTYFMGLEQRTGLCAPIEVAKNLGLTRADGTPLQANLNFTLGVDEVTPLGMAEAYATFANHGIHCSSIAISAVTDPSGKSLRVPDPQCDQAIERNVADSVTAILSQVIDGPLDGRTGRVMSLGRPAAGKTGTTNASAAVWFVGYTPDLAGAVWTGDPRGGFKYKMKNLTIGGRYYDQVFGSTLPGPIWKEAMLAALQGTPKLQFDLRTVDGLGTWTPPPVYQPPPPGSTPGASPTSTPTGGPTPPATTPPASPTPKPTP